MNCEQRRAQRAQRPKWKTADSGHSLLSHLDSYTPNLALHQYLLDRKKSHGNRKLFQVDSRGTFINTSSALTWQHDSDSRIKLGTQSTKSTTENFASRILLLFKSDVQCGTLIVFFLFVLALTAFQMMYQCSFLESVLYKTPKPFFYFIFFLFLLLKQDIYVLKKQILWIPYSHSYSPSSWSC